MTEEDWLRAAGPGWGLDYLCNDGNESRSGLRYNRTAFGRRKLRLYLCGCVRRVWESIPDGPCREAVELGERLADGEVVADRVAALHGYRDRSGPGSRRHAASAAMACVEKNIRYAANFGSQAAARVAGWRRVEEAGGDHMPHDAAGVADEGRGQVGLLREVFGNPFRRVVMNPSWRTEAVVGLACGMYESRGFAPMPVLADAREDAGCDQPDVLAHCRGSGPHIRGCWVVDQVLGKG